MALTKLGLYEQILDDATQAAVEGLNEEHFQVLRRPLDAGDSHSYLVQHLARQIGFVLRSLPVEGRLDAQVALSNKIIELLETGAPASAKGTQANVTPHAELLLAVVRKEVDRPDTPLGTSGKDEHGFCHLPAGCVISLERMAREYVLENIRQAISQKPESPDSADSRLRDGGGDKTFVSVFGRISPTRT